MQNLCKIIDGLTGIKPNIGTVANMLHSAADIAKPIVEIIPLHRESTKTLLCIVTKQE